MASYNPVNKMLNCSHLENTRRPERSQATKGDDMGLSFNVVSHSDPILGNHVFSQIFYRPKPNQFLSAPFLCALCGLCGALLILIFLCALSVLCGEYLCKVY
jgi:hypothetical protein